MRTTITGNYVDNCFIEINNEHDSDPDFASELSFGGLTIDGNVFMASNCADWFTWIVVKPYGSGHFLHGLHITQATPSAPSTAVLPGPRAWTRPMPASIRAGCAT